MSLAASPTAFIVNAENAYGIMAPSNNPENSRAYKIFTSFRPLAVTNAPKRARPTKQADPIAKPFPIAAVVFPAASNLSVATLTDGCRPVISAIPPALSLIGQ